MLKNEIIYKKMKYEKRVITKFEDLSREEQIKMKRRLTKCAKEIKTNSDNLLYGKEARKSKPKGKIIKGEFNWRMQPKDLLVIR